MFIYLFIFIFICEIIVVSTNPVLPLLGSTESSTFLKVSSTISAEVVVRANFSGYMYSK